MFDNIKRIGVFVRNSLKYSRFVKFDKSCIIVKGSTFEGANYLGAHSAFNGAMGYGSYMCDNSDIIGNIGRFTSIGPNVKVNLGTHPFSLPFATTSPLFYSTQNIVGTTFADHQVFNEFMSPVEIGNDCWIGQNVFICGSVSVGDGAVVYAGSVVTKDVPPYAIVAGVPAKVLRYRYDEGTIEKLLQYKWWNMDKKWLRDNWQLLTDIDSLIDKFIHNG